MHRIGRLGNAPQVKSTNSGFCVAMRPIRSYRFCTPSDVRGGKYSNDTNGLPPASQRRILSKIFSLAITCVPSPLPVGHNWPASVLLDVGN